MSRNLLFGHSAIRRDTDANFTLANPVLRDGEMVFVRGYPPRFKVGDGSARYADLDFVGTEGATGAPGSPTSYVTGRTGSKFLSAHALLYRAFGYAVGTFSTPPIGRVLVLGDSMANTMWSIWAGDFSKRMGGLVPNATPVASNAGYTLAGGKLSLLTGTATLTSNAYEYGPRGQYYALASGADTTWGTGGSAAIFQTGRVWYIKEPGAGRIKVDVGGVNVADEDASAASIELASITLTNASTTNTALRIYTSGGPVKLIEPYVCQTTVPGLWYFNEALGGLSLGLAMSQATGRAILGAMIADIKPHMILLEEKENITFATDGLSTTFASELAVRSDIIDANKPASCDVVFVSSNAYVQRTQYDPNQQAAAVANRATLAAHCAARDYLYFDGYEALGEDAVLVDALYGSVMPLVANFRGVHASGNSYAVGDVVSNSGPTYRCFSATSNAPPNASFFTAWGNAYSAGTTYRQHDVVTSGIYTWSYINGTPGAGNAPPTAPTDYNAHWQMLDGFSLDGTHTNKIADVYRVGLFNAMTGIEASPYGFVSGPMNETGSPSRIMGGSVFSYGKTAQEVKIRSESTSSAVVWRIDWPQKLEGWSISAGKMLFAFSQFGVNTGANLAQFFSYLGGSITLDGDGSMSDATHGKTILAAGAVGSVTGVQSRRRTSGNTTVLGNLGVSGIQLEAMLVAGLPAAATNIDVSFIVTDANATTFNSIVAGGGANRMVVRSDGTNWRIG